MRLATGKRPVGSVPYRHPRIIPSLVNSRNDFSPAPSPNDRSISFILRLEDS